MLESDIHEKVKQQAKLFLRDVMGKETYDKFISEGKIEIKSGGCTYELTTDGTVINKTRNQRYCVILSPRTPDRDSIPLSDMLAIKYAWLKYSTKTVETVANKTVIGIERLTAMSLTVDAKCAGPTTVTVVWKNSGTSSIAFRPAIVIDDMTIVDTAENITIDAGETRPIIIIIPTLSIGEHCICVCDANTNIR